VAASGSITAGRGALLGACLGIAASIAVGLAALRPGSLFIWPTGSLNLALAILGGAVVGWAIVHLLHLGVDDALLQKQAPRLMPGETAVIVQASATLLGKAIAVLRG
jgi:hypothetical protein